MDIGAVDVGSISVGSSDGICVAQAPSIRKKIVKYVRMFAIYAILQSKTTPAAHTCPYEFVVCEAEVRLVSRFEIKNLFECVFAR